jgi:lipid-A-disaccharide synthase-like uncharacterized protein
LYTRKGQIVLLYVLLAVIGVMGVAFLTARWGVAWLTQSDAESEKLRRARYYEGLR